MFKDDYIMRIVNQVAIVLAAALGLTKESKYDEAQATIDDAMQQYLGMSSDEIDDLSYQALIARLSQHEMAGTGQMLMLTELLRAEADIDEALGNEDAAAQRYLKAVNIQLELVTGNKLSQIPVDGNVDYFIEALDDYVLPLDTSMKLFEYYDKVGVYSEAEDLLYELLDDRPSNEKLINMGLSFYERLLVRSDTELMAGNLPREEVDSGFNEMLDMQEKYLS